MDEQRLIEIESRVAWQDDALREISDALARQQQELERLRALCQSLRSRLDAVADLARHGPPADEPPPHY